MKDTDKTVAVAAVRAAAGKLRAAVKRDRDHRVRLLEPFFVGVLPAEFDGRRVLTWTSDKIVIDADRRLTILPDPPDGLPSCDGASLAPDRVGGIDIAPGYIPHDALYDEMGDIAEDPEWRAAGWTEQGLRDLFDYILGRMIKREEDREAEKARTSKSWIKRAYYATIGALRPVSRIYYTAVRRFGGIYHRATSSIVLVLLAAALCAGCSAGCLAIPDDGFIPSDDNPIYEVVPLSAEGR